MPQYFLKIKADLENIKSIIPIRGNLWKLDIQTPGGAETRTGITISTNDVFLLEGLRGDANFIINWPYDTDQSFMRILNNHEAVQNEYLEKDSGNYVPILALECNNIEPIAWQPGFDFVIVSKSGTKFSEVDLTNRDWADFDDTGNFPVSITNLDYRIDSYP